MRTCAFILLLAICVCAVAQQQPAPSQRIAYTRSAKRSVVLEERDLLVSNLGDNKQELIAQLAFFPSWSPDGTRLVYFGQLKPIFPELPRLNLMVYDFATRKTSTLLDVRNNSSPQRAAWSPDGKRIAFAFAKRDKTELVGIDVETRKVQPMTLSGGITCASDPSWAPDGKSLVVYECAKDKRGLAVIDLTGRLLRRLTTPDSGDSDRFPAWSPDGKQIAFTSSRGSKAKGVREKPRRSSIFVVDADGANLHSLVTHDQFSIGLPSWSSDGKLLACVAVQPSPVLQGEEGTKVLILSVPDWQVRAMLDEGTSEPALAPMPR